MTTKRDYYEVLGINKSATADEIKSAYRKLALEYHPDRNKEANAEEKFKEINEAYQILSNPEKRQKYDQFGHSAFDPRAGMGQNPFAGGFQQGPFTWTYSSSQNPFAGGDFIDPFEIFNSFFGGNYGRGGKTYQSYSMKLSFMEAALGAEKTIEVEGKKQKIKIPAGVDDGTRIRFDQIYITFDVGDDPYFKREGADLFVDVYLPLSTLILGGSIKIRTLTGELKMKVREGTASHTMVRLSQEGLPYLQKNGKGNMYVRLIAQIPEKLNREQRKAVEKLQEAGF